MRTNKHITAALVGNPNTGKSTFFNAWTGLHQITGNWPGVTVEKHLGQLTLPTGESLTIVDLPGIYSLYAISEDEKVATSYVCSGEPDIIINIVDAVNLERNLYLTLALMELGKPMILVLSMTDITSKQGTKININELSTRLGIPVLLANVSKKNHRQALEKAITTVLSTPQVHPRIDLPEVITSSLKRVISEGEPAFYPIHRLEGILPGAESLINDIEAETGATPDIHIADARYATIEKITQGLIVKGEKASIQSFADKLVLNRWLGIPIFLAIMYILFWMTQVVGGCFIDFFDLLGDALFVTGLGNILSLCGAPEWVNTFFATGLGGGIQTVMTFIPPVFFIFMGLAILEDSGYMARAAYVVDRFMRFLGLPGSAFVPMLVGFGCTVPAIMATRTLSNRRDRLLTIFMAPFMSCGARLPVYALFGAAFFGIASGGMVFCIYISGILLAVLSGLLLKRTLFVGDPAPFVMELPIYHMPRPLTVLKRAWNRLSGFIFRAGKVMALMVLILTITDAITFPSPFDTKTKDTQASSEISAIECAGRLMAPIFEPMGVTSDNWQGSVALIVGLFAKEQVVSSLNTLYGSEIEEESAATAQTWGEAATSFKEGILEAVASIPEAFSSLLGGFFDAFGLSVFHSEYENMISLVEANNYEEVLKKIDIEGAQVALIAAQQAALDTPSNETQEALIEAQKARAQASIFSTAIQNAQHNPNEKAHLIQLLTEAHETALASAGADADHSLLEKLREKFGHNDEGRHRAFAYLLFVLLYVPCLAAMATIIREIGWKYATILFTYLTVLGWCVATLYFQLTVAFQLVWITIPLLLLGLIMISFYLIGRKHKVKLVV